LELSKATLALRTAKRLQKRGSRSLT
jgi:hypothetical protein